MSANKPLLQQVENYYSEKVRQHGANAKGVDWNSEASQELRFQQLLKVIAEPGKFSLLDYGCGYGAMLKFMTDIYPDMAYTGFDISEEMLQKAKEQDFASAAASWTPALKNEAFNYTIASGIFNVRLNQNEPDWKKYVEEVLTEINSRSNRGFSFNMLTSFSDKEYMRDYLYYADPAYYFNFCKKHFSKQVALLHDYHLYEFTIIVKKEV
ncbi:MAG: class I SAM-dependent methyltransferase [Ferruginibacter sp.]